VCQADGKGQSAMTECRVRACTHRPARGAAAVRAGTDPATGQSGERGVGLGGSGGRRCSPRAAVCRTESELLAGNAGQGKSLGLSITGCAE
jgi:hypothetical protein